MICNCGKHPHAPWCVIHGDRFLSFRDFVLHEMDWAAYGLEVGAWRDEGEQLQLTLVHDSASMLLAPRSGATEEGSP